MKDYYLEDGRKLENTNILSQEQFDEYLEELSKDELTEIRKVRIVNELISHFKEMREREVKIGAEHNAALKEHETLKRTNDHFKEVLEAQSAGYQHSPHLTIESIERGER